MLGLAVSGRALRSAAPAGDTWEPELQGPIQERAEVSARARACSIPSPGRRQSAGHLRAAPAQACASDHLSPSPHLGRPQALRDKQTGL